MELATLSPLKYLKIDNLNKIFLGVLIASSIFGILAGFLLAGSNRSAQQEAVTKDGGIPAKVASQDTKTFRDFAEGTIQKRPAPKNPDQYLEGTHLLVRDGAVPVALTSSVVDLSQYEGKKVVVRGETQKAIKEGWLMDVGKVELK